MLQSFTSIVYSGSFKKKGRRSREDIGAKWPSSDYLLQIHHHHLLVQFWVIFLRGHLSSRIHLGPSQIVLHRDSKWTLAKAGGALAGGGGGL